MFIPLFIAILLGLVNPSTGNTCPNNNNTVVNTQGTPDDGGDGDGGDTGGGGPVTGENGQLPPPKP